MDYIKNTFCDTDAYKLTHPWQYPDGLDHMFSYGESRIGSRFEYVCFYGMDIIVREHFQQKPTKELVEEAYEECLLCFGTDAYFNKDVANKVLKLGYWPIRIRAVREGSVVPISNTLFTLESTEKWFAKSANAFETLLMHVWYPTTIATNSMYIKRIITPYFEKSGTPEGVQYACHDFGMRGTTCFEQGAIGGSAHLLWFKGSDTMSASRLIKHIYGVKGRLNSVWATEHSVATSFGPGEGEKEYVKHQIRMSKIKGTEHLILSLVIDSYDTFNFITNVVGDPEIKQMIIDRPGRIVFRPDSGEPKMVINKCLELLRNVFGYTINDKGYKVLNENVGLLQGDGMKLETIDELYSSIVRNSWSADNLVVGSGGGLLQANMDRDTQRFAIKASYGAIDGVPFNIQKNPATSDFKKSKTGKLKLHLSGSHYTTISSANQTEAMFGAYDDALETILENGVITRTQNFNDIIKRAEEQSKWIK